MDSSWLQVSVNHNAFDSTTMKMKPNSEQLNVVGEKQDHLI